MLILPHGLLLLYTEYFKIVTIEKYIHTMIRLNAFKIFSRFIIGYSSYTQLTPEKYKILPFGRTLMPQNKQIILKI